MTIEAPLSRSTRTTFIIYIVACLAMAAWFGYDGYLNKSFIAAHTDEQGNANGTLAFNQKSPPFLLGAAIVFAAYYFVIRSRKIVANESELIVCNKEKIPYDAIERIDKTHFERKGFFTLIYKKDGRETSRRFSDRNYDNLGPVLDHLIAQIT